MISKRQKKCKTLQQKYKVKSTGYEVILGDLKQRLKAKSMKIERYDQRIEQYKINRFSHQDQKRVFQQLSGKVNSDVKSDADESIRFWSKIWDNKVHHRKGDEWLRGQKTCRDDRK